MDIDTLARDISECLGVSPAEAHNRLAKGFHHNHALVAEDFKKNRPDNDELLLSWYRETDAYIWELSAYHLEPGFNYMGMCEGIAVHLKNAGKEEVISLGDGVGDLCIVLAEHGLRPYYHDLSDSFTAKFAKHRFSKLPDLEIPMVTTNGWEPDAFVDSRYDAVVALDFFEHLVNVEEWAQAVYNCLRPDGVFLAQNAFAIGDEEHGDSIPMHLSVNNKYEHEWAPLMDRIGFENDGGWWRKCVR